MSTVNNPMYSPAAPPEKKSNKGLILGILGCGGLLILVCCGGVVYFGYYFYNVGMNNQGVQQAKELASSSAEVREALGDNITFEMPTEVNNPSPDSIFYRIPLSGTKGSGTMVLTVRNTPGTMQFELESASVELSGGNSITLK